MFNTSRRRFGSGRNCGRAATFAILTEHAERVELCLFDSARMRPESQRIALPERTDLVWHGYLPDILPRQLYGYRVYGSCVAWG